MADITITAANVVSGAGAKIEQGYAGETVVAGKWVYRDPTTKKYMLADRNSRDAGGAQSARRGALRILAQSTAVRSNRGRDHHGRHAGRRALRPICRKRLAACARSPTSPAGGYSTVLGMAKSTTVFDIDIQESGVAV